MSDPKRDVALRHAAKFHLIANPNYFGNLTDLKLPGLPKAVLKKTGDTGFEELTCLGYNPDTEILTAIVRIKQQTGYGGDACTDGSQEYIRFYLDYGDGNWVDHGTAGFTIHDLPFKEPLCYAVSIKITPKRRSCCDDKPVLPNVRAILSWNTMPPPNMPNWMPVWGNRLERDIQIEPRNWFICKLTDVITDIGIQKIDPVFADKLTAAVTKLPPPKPEAPLPELMKIAKGEDRDLAVMRNVFPAVVKLAAEPDNMIAFQALSPLKAFDIDIGKFTDFLGQPNFNTTYEELHCVGLDRDATMLHGVVQIKRKSGYSGNLCQKGSREYIAFYLDFGSGWEYQGTTWVEVHDVDVPKGGLWYQAALPVNLDKHRKEWCKTGQARIRGILSWAVPPAPNQPNFVPHWGDREDCWIEVRPLPKGLPEGIATGYLDSIGNMPVDQIDAAGFAHGNGVGNVPSGAAESPFGGRINLAGALANAPSGPIKYQVMVRQPGDLLYSPWTESFVVSVTTITGGSISHADQTQATVGGFFTYIPQSGAVFKSVKGDLLAAYHSSKQGPHHVYVAFYDATTNALISQTTPEAFYVNTVHPKADVEITGGNCRKFNVGEPMMGTYSMTSDFARVLSLSVTPVPEANGGDLTITTLAPAALLVPPFGGAGPSVSVSYGASQLTTVGAAGNWTLDTHGMEPCGYNIRIEVWDRTIVDSHQLGWPGSDIEGFCIE